MTWDELIEYIEEKAKEYEVEEWGTEDKSVDNYCTLSFGTERLEVIRTSDEPEEWVGDHSGEYELEVDLDDFLEEIDGAYFTEEALEEKELIDSISEYDFNTCIWKNDLYAAIDINGNTRYWVKWDNGSTTLCEDEEDGELTLIGAYAGEIWAAFDVFHFGTDEQKKMFFGDELDDIKEFVRDSDYNFYKIVKEISLPVSNPAYVLPHVGLTEDGEIVFYNYNNCNVKTNDVPEVDEGNDGNFAVFSDIEELKESGYASVDEIELIKKELLEES
jgi:hypothetical protein